jgi:hypothetical protein
MRNAIFGLWIVGGVGLFIIAVVHYFDSYCFKTSAVSLSGEVVSSTVRNGTQRTTVPIVRYVTPSGEEREHRYGAPLAGKEHWIGEKVTILYDLESGKAKMDDWNELYLWPSLLAFTAFLILLPLVVGGIIYLYFRRSTANAAVRLKE